MRPYLDLLDDILAHGTRKDDRTGIGTLSVFARQLRFDLQAGFPLVTTKKVFAKGVIHELLWLLSGDTNIGYLSEHGVHIWDAWSDENGDLGPVYGRQWRAWPAPDGREETIDQIARAVHLLRTDPDSRRIVVSAWNAGDLDRMALAPCHCLFQFYSREATDAQRKRWAAHGCNGRSTDWRVLDCQLYQRSADVFIGVPFNIASYALLVMMMAQVTDHIPGEFVHTFGDAHIYLNHLEQVRTQLSRNPRQLPTMTLNPDIREIDEYTYGDFNLSGYDPHPAIKAEVAV